jgi:hypothetical protein
MVPESLGTTAAANPTPGESAFYYFARDCLTPHNRVTCWYEPYLLGRRATAKPDFVVFEKDLGLVIVEVKDWRIADIEKFEQREVKLRSDQGTRTNPLVQMEGHYAVLKDRLREAGLTHGTGPHRGKPKLPITCLAAFPYITTSQYTGAKLDGVVPVDRVLLQDELEKARTGASGTRLLTEKVEPKVLFPAAPLAQGEAAVLAQALSPACAVSLPQRRGEGKARLQEELVHLDALQSRVAYKLKRGHRIVEGVAGTGKTMILVERCRYLTEHDPRVKRSLILCFNIALARYIERLAQERAPDPSKGSIEVTHFYELCAQVLREAVPYEGKQEDYYADVRQLALDAAKGSESGVRPYDAIYVDEGQDFDEGMFALVASLLRKDGDLVVALDPEQVLYRRRFSWKAIGIDVAGKRPTVLPTAYRGTVELQRFAGALLKRGEEEQSAQLTLGFAKTTTHGEWPEFRSCASHGDAAEFVAEDVRRLIDAGDYRRSEIAVVYDDKIYAEDAGRDGMRYGSRDFAKALQREMRARGTPARWVSQDYRAKEEFDITTDRVALISLHSAKGLDFDLVYLVLGDSVSELDGAARQRLYVGVTRAKHHLVIVYTRKTEVVRALEAARREAKQG